MTCMPASRSPSTPVRRRSRSPGGRCCASTTRTSPARPVSSGAKRINVAHDWLSDPELRRAIRPRTRPAPIGPRHGRSRPAPGPGRRGARARPDRPAPSPDPAEALARFLDRVATLEPDEIDRLACAEPPPIAFGATIARFLPEDRLAALAAMATAVDARLDPAAAARPGVRDAVEGFGTELVLGDFLDELLTDPFRERARERLTRGWQAAVGQPRYGPNGVAVARAHRPAGGPRRGRRARRWPRRPGGPASTGSPTSRGRPAPRRTTTRRCGSPRSWRRGMPRRPSRRPSPTRPPWPARAGPRGGSLTCSSCATPSRRPRSPRSPGRGVPRFLPDDRPAARVRPRRGD